jgi:transcriptional regulator with AAA-type ATPase domain
MTVRLRLTCGDEEREVAFDRTSISVGGGPFNDLVFPDIGLPRVLGEFEVREDATLAFRSRANTFQTEVLRDGQRHQLACGDQEELIRLRAGDRLRMGKEPSLDIEIVDVKVGPCAQWSTLGLGQPNPEQLSPATIRLLYRLTRQLAEAPGVERFLAAAALFVTHVAEHAPARIEVAIPLEMDPWRSDDYIFEDLSLPEPQHPDDTDIEAVGGSFSHTRAPYASFGAEVVDIIGQLQKLDRCVLLDENKPLESVLVPFERGEVLAAVLDIGYERGHAQACAERVAESAALFQPLAAIVLGDLRQHRRCAGFEEENRYWRKRQRRHYLFKDLIAESEAMREVYEKLNACVGDHEPVLIAGQAGSGKALLARAIHHLGPRSEAMLSSLNCRALSGDELDFELFGSVANELSGDVEPRMGIFELADGGTVFLEEIDQLSLMLQGKLLRMLRESEVRRIGDAVARRVDVRLIVSSHCDLSEMVARGQFRRDLYLAISESVLSVPPLDERPEDILPLARTFLKKFADRYDRPCRRFADDVPERLIERGWQGNVRELKSLVEVAVLECDDEVVDAAHLGLSC